jgi:hypothetical protein
MGIPCPTLTLSGWVTASAEKADYLIAHFFEADAAQSYLYNGNISSLQYIVEQYSNNIVALTQQLRTALEQYLGRYYDNCVVEVTSNDNATNTTGSITLSLYVRVSDDGQTYSFGKLLQISNNKISKIIDMNNNQSISSN